MKNFIFLLLLILFPSLRTCKTGNTSDRDIYNLKENYFDNTEIIKRVKNIKTNQIKDFLIQIDTTNTFEIDGILFSRINIQSYGDSIYFGSKKRTLYTYDMNLNYYEKMFSLNNVEFDYTSFLAGIWYNVDYTSVSYDSKLLDSIYTYNLSIPKFDNQSDHIIVDNKDYKSPNFIFRKIVFSKKLGIISAVILDKESNNLYSTMKE